MEASPLEIWANHLIGQTTQYLNSRYLSKDTVEEEIASLCQDLNTQKYLQGEIYDISDDLLNKIHEKIYSCDSEVSIWSAIINYIKKPLPVRVANDLVDRGIAIDALGHSRQVDEVQWRLSKVYDEALLTFATDLYTSSNRDLLDFKRLIEQFSGHYWMLETLSLLGASSLDKERIYLATIEQHPRYNRLSQLHQISRLRVRASDPDTNPEEIRTLFLMREPKVLRELASNPQTPTDILVDLSQIKNIKLAKEIRALARENLKARGTD